MAAKDERVAQLFALPPEEFTAARDRLARELKDAGDPAAAEVPKLRRPTVGAWVVNELARRDRALLNELLRLGEELRAAQRRVIEGGSREELREAGIARRRLIDRLLDRGEEILRDAGRPAARHRLDGVERTLLAATMSEEAAEEIARGTLTRELDAPAGFELMVLDAPAAPATRPSRRGERLRARAQATEEQAGRAEDRAAGLEQEAQAAERAAREARQAAERAAREARRARDRADDLARQADEAGSGG